MKFLKLAQKYSSIVYHSQSAYASSIILNPSFRSKNPDFYQSLAKFVFLIHQFDYLAINFRLFEY